jgi:hypothetical protein
VLTRRTQILLDEDRYGRLARQSAETGASIGALIREAIDVAFPGVPTDRERAGQMLLDAPPMPVDEWQVMKRERDALYERG